MAGVSVFMPARLIGGCLRPALPVLVLVAAFLSCSCGAEPADGSEVPAAVEAGSLDDLSNDAAMPLLSLSLGWRGTPAAPTLPAGDPLDDLLRNADFSQCADFAGRLSPDTCRVVLSMMYAYAGFEQSPCQAALEAGVRAGARSGLPADQAAADIGKVAAVVRCSGELGINAPGGTDVWRMIERERSGRWGL